MEYLQKAIIWVFGRLHDAVDRGEINTNEDSTLLTDEGTKQYEKILVDEGFAPTHKDIMLILLEKEFVDNKTDAHNIASHLLMMEI
jgi:hypothetical protein